MKYQDFNIKTKLTIFIFCLLSLTMLACMGIADRISYDLLREQKMDALETSAQDKTHLLRQYIVAQQNDVLIMSTSSKLKQLVDLKTKFETDSAHQEVKTQYEKLRQSVAKSYARFLNMKPTYFKFSYLDQSGQEIISIQNQEGKFVILPDTALVYQGGETYFKEAMLLSPKKTYTSSIHLYKENGQVDEMIRPVIQFAMPIFTNNDEKQKGIVVISVELKDVLNQIAQNQKEGNVYLIDHKGYFLFHHDKTQEWGQDMGHKTRIQYHYADQEVSKGLISSVPYYTEYEGEMLMSMPLFLSEDHTRFLKIIQEYPKSLILKKVKKQTLLLILFGVIVLIIAVILSTVVSGRYIKKLVLIRDEVDNLISGRKPQHIVVKGRDEIDEISQNMNILTENLYQMTEFAQQVGKRNYYSNYKFTSEVALGEALIKMRNNLQKASQERKINHWISNGQNLFNTLLRTHTNLKVLAEQVLIELVKYLQFSQGSLFLINSDVTQLDLVATYAWDRQKYLTKSILKGDGLIGEVWEEGQTIYLEEIPKDYIKIKSGLGTANPTALLIVPIKNNEEIIGIMELASFSKIETYKIDFIEFVCQITGIAFANIFNSSKTEKLLKQTQKYSETLRVQEEEMRQNAEELSSTQEEMQRQIQDYEEKIKQLEA